MLLALLVCVSGLTFEAAFRLDRNRRIRIREAEAEFERLVVESAPTIRLTLRPDSFVFWAKKDGTTQHVVVISVENTGAEALDDCFIRVSYRAAGTELPAAYSRFRVCAPFSLIPDDDKSVPVLKAIDGYGEAGFLTVPTFVMENGNWVEFGDVSVVLRKAAWTIRIEALSRTTRRAVLEFGVQYVDGVWGVHSAPSSQ
jgi:hypothetical protein